MKLGTIWGGQLTALPALGDCQAPGVPQSSLLITKAAMCWGRPHSWEPVSGCRGPSGDQGHIGAQDPLESSGVRGTKSWVLTPPLLDATPLLSSLLLQDGCPHLRVFMEAVRFSLYIWLHQVLVAVHRIFNLHCNTLNLLFLWKEMNPFIGGQNFTVKLKAI